MNALKKIVYNYIIPSIGQLNSRKNQYVNVIYYHDIVDGPGSTYMKLPFGKFKRQMEYLKNNGWQTLRFDDLRTNEDCLCSNTKKAVLITFDDGWASNYDMIFDYMHRSGLKYNIFLEVGKIGLDPNYLTWEQVKEMHTSGIVGFGAHTFNHPNMSDISELDLSIEIDKANQIINQQLGITPRDFCFPYGAYSHDSLSALVDRHSYDRIYTSDLRYSYPMDGQIIFGRNAISDAESFNVFKHKLKGNFNIWHNLMKAIL